VTYNDTMGSFGRTIRPAVREFEQKEKDRQKRAMEQSNAQDVEELESYIRHITGLHHDTIEPIDWAAQTRPEARALYEKMCQGDDSALMTVIKSQQRLSGIHKLGRGLGFTVEGGQVHAILALHNQSIVPDFHLKYMPSGKLTEVKMPRDKRLRIYRAYASSAVLKVASDLLRLVPVRNVVVSAIAPCRVVHSDFEEEWPVLSVNLLRERILSMDMANIAPVVALQAFQNYERFHQEHVFGRVVTCFSIPARISL